ncbi:uncharacterized protein LOC123303010 [Chrysoperla carnea]|uniref:uncharacterized protein LOC123303010 n=1 Tax=Chrysoperla carnea TaxID=189513 RepID=UPI001D05D13A|nr:uncharacterized protein LOC123303010 [Chrysoperla carnea]
MYADDTSVILSSDNIHSLMNEMNIVIQQFADWCKNNHLIINVTKTTFLVFKNKVNDASVITSSIKYPITQVSEMKSLGIILDEGMKWNRHVDTVCKKLGTAYFYIKKLKQTHNTEALLAVYYAFVYAAMQYCNIKLEKQPTTELIIKDEILENSGVTMENERIEEVQEDNFTMEHRPIKNEVLEDSVTLKNVRIKNEKLDSSDMESEQIHENLTIINYGNIMLEKQPKTEIKVENETSDESDLETHQGQNKENEFSYDSSSESDEQEVSCPICNKSFNENRTDFFQLFIVKSSNSHLCKKILSYVDPIDLSALDCVCKCSSQLIRKTDSLNQIRLNYLYNVKIYKENVKILNNNNFKTSTPNDLSKLNKHAPLLQHSVEKSLKEIPLLELNQLLPRKSSQSTPEVSPNKRKWLKYFKLSQNLLPNETLQRCINCSNPAIVLNNVVRCTRKGCLFIYCDQCFNPMCHSVQFYKYHMKNDENLDLEKLRAPIVPPPCSKAYPNQQQISFKNEASSMSTLSDISNSSIFSNIPATNIPNYRKDNNKVRRTLIFANSIKSNTSDSIEQQSSRYSIDNSREVSPSDSPPRIKVNDCIIGSKKSKKRLKRL